MFLEREKAVFLSGLIACGRSCWKDSAQSVFAQGNRF